MKLMDFSFYGELNTVKNNLNCFLIYECTYMTLVAAVYTLLLRIEVGIRFH